jgi:hypothetical protein
MPYTLRRTWPEDDRRSNDYVVCFDGREVGRMYLTIVPGGDRWRWWSIYINRDVQMVEGVASVGIASDFEQAKQEFRNSFDRMRR